MCVCDADVANKLSIEKLSSVTGVVTGNDEIIILTNKIRRGMLAHCSTVCIIRRPMSLLML